MTESKQLRLLFVGAFPPPELKVFGGNVTDCRALLQSSLSHRVDLNLLDTTQISNPPPSLAIRLPIAARRMIRFLHRFERWRPDVVLLFTSTGASLLEKGMMAWYARIRRVPALMFPRGGAVLDVSPQARLRRWWLRLWFGGARKVLCQGEAWRSFATDVLGIAATDAPIIPNWTASPDLLTIGRNREQQDGRPVRMIYVGWLERKKGVAELLDACRLLASDREFTLDIVGEGSFSSEARQIVATHGLAEVVRFRGWLQTDALHEVLRAAEVFVLPSWAEGLPNAMIEAMAAGLAIVVTPVGCIPDVVTDGHDAVLAPLRDSEALSKSVARVLDDAELRQRLGVAAFRLAESRFGVEQAVELLVNELNAVTGREAPGGVLHTDA